MERKPEIEKELYVSPKMTVIKFNAEDIITTSGEIEDDEIPETNDDTNFDRDGWSKQDTRKIISIFFAKPLDKSAEMQYNTIR